MIEGVEIMKPKVIVFGTPTCSWCKKVKEYLKSNGFAFKDVDVSKDAHALADMIRKTGQQGVPQTWIDNQPVVGFDKAKLDRLLGIKR
ncbi:MAG: glutaredoxin 3 [Candidatus Cloacimonadota bacterium]|nr:glutaredoxin 3 [Candidatus Cloacimonadota bacterium]